MAKTKATPGRIRKIARERLGFESLRAGQQEAVESVLEGRDTLVVQPTGSGKSAVYQIAGLMIEGATVIVSPLIALQKDQVDSIQDQNSSEAAAINSAQGIAETRLHRRRVGRGEIEFIFLAPEQLRKQETIDLLQRAGVSLFVVDEAHCISEWGHDFRPDYLQLGNVIEALGHPRVLALTATASLAVRGEIVERLHMRQPRIFVRGFDRPNIYLRVDRFKTEAEKREALVHRARWADKPGIIYVATRRAAEEIMYALAGEGIESVFYHAGLNARQREEIQDRFMSGDVEVIVATNAFGMGVDKPDIRFVYHQSAADSLDSYYQEIGRAGRDGQRAEAVLFYRSEDIGAQSFKTGEGRLDPRAVERLVTRLAEEEGPVAREEVAEDVGMSGRKLTSALQRLEDVGAAETLPGGTVRLEGDPDPKDIARAASEQQERRREAKRERLETMREYADTASCRREFLLRYFADGFAGPCHFCDNCDSRPGEVTPGPAGGTRREVA